MLEEEDVPEAESERSLRRHERRMGHSLVRLTAAQEAYHDTRTQETKRQLQLAKVAHARMRKTHRLLQRAHQEEHDARDAPVNFGGPGSGRYPAGTHGNTDSSLSRSRGKVLTALSQAGTAATHGMHAAESAIGKGFNRLPKTLQNPVRGIFKLLFAPYLAGQTIAREVARQKGGDEHADAVARTLAKADIVGAKGVSALATVAPHVASIAYWFPMASMGYLAFSAAKNPLKTIKGASIAIRQIAQGLGKAPASALRGTREVASELGGVARAAREKVGFSADSDSTPSPEDAALLLSRFRAHANTDWYEALLSVALDHTHDLREAVDLADQAYQKDPDPPSEDDEEMDEEALINFAWDSDLHPRGQPENKGRFISHAHDYIKENGPATAAELAKHLVDRGAKSLAHAHRRVRDMVQSGHLVPGKDKYGRDTHSIPATSSMPTAPSTAAPSSMLAQHGQVAQPAQQQSAKQQISLSYLGKQTYQSMAQAFNGTNRNAAAQAVQSFFRLTHDENNHADMQTIANQFGVQPGTDIHDAFNQVVQRFDKKFGVDRASLEKSVPQLKKFGDMLNVHGAFHPTIQKAALDLVNIPDHLVGTMRANGATIHLGATDITSLDALQRLRKMSPDRHKKGSKFETIGGVFVGFAKNPVVAVGLGASGCISTALHESGHAIGFSVKKDGVPIDTHPELANIHKAIYDKLQPYYQQKGPGTKEGMSELFAEGFATIIKNRPLALQKFGPQFVGWMEHNLQLKR